MDIQDFRKNVWRFQVAADDVKVATDRVIKSWHGGSYSPIITVAMNAEVVVLRAIVELAQGR